MSLSSSVELSLSITNRGSDRLGRTILPKLPDTHRAVFAKSAQGSANGRSAATLGNDSWNLQTYRQASLGRNFVNGIFEPRKCSVALSWPSQVLSDRRFMSSESAISTLDGYLLPPMILFLVNRTAVRGSRCCVYFSRSVLSEGTHARAPKGSPRREWEVWLRASGLVSGECLRSPAIAVGPFRRPSKQ